MSSLYDAVQSAKADLRDFIFGDEHPERDSDEITDRIMELAYGEVPIMTADVLEMALDDLRLAVDTPEIGMGSCDSPLRAIQQNIYDNVSQALWDVVEGLFDERDEQEADEDDEDEDDEPQEDAVLDIADDGAYEA